MEPPKWCSPQLWELSKDRCLYQDRSRVQYQWDHQVTIKLQKQYHCMLNWCRCHFILLPWIVEGQRWISRSTVNVSLSPAINCHQHPHPNNIPTFVVCKLAVLLMNCCIYYYIHLFLKIQQYFQNILMTTRWHHSLGFRQYFVSEMQSIQLAHALMFFHPCLRSFFDKCLTSLTALCTGLEK